LWKWLREDVSKLIFGGDELDMKKLLCNTFPHKVIVNFDVLGTSMKNWMR
jgi:hypothetical protein